MWTKINSKGTQMTIYIVQRIIEGRYEKDDVEIVFVTTSKAEVEKFKSSNVPTSGYYYDVQVWRNGERQYIEER